MRRRFAAIGGGPADRAGSGRRRWIAAALVLTTLFCIPRLAGPAEDRGLEREFGFLEAEDVEKIPLSVVSRGPAIPAGQAPAVVDVITADEIRLSGARTLAELLSQRVGIDVSLDRVVPRGLNTSPSTAGITLANHRTLLLIDGRPTNDVFFGEFLAGRELPLEYIERIEIIRGPGSALYGTNAMAGVINVVTKDYADEPGPGAIGEYGSFSTRRIDGFAGAGRPDLNGNFFFRYFATGGPNQVNRNDNQRQYFGFGRSSLGPLTLESDALDFRRELPGTEQAPTPDDHAHRSRYSIAGRLDPTLGDDVRLTARVYANLYQTRLLVASERQNSLLGPSVAAAPTNYDERRVGEELALSYSPLSWLSVTIGGEARQERGDVVHGGCIGRTATGSATVVRGCSIGQDVYAAFLEDRVSLPADVALTAGFRYDEVSLSGGRLNPRADLVWKPEPRTTVKVGYGEAFRAPSFFELHGAQQFGSNTVVLGNPNLDPEVVRTVEGEVTHAFARSLNVRVSSFFTHGRDMITQNRSLDLLNTGICPPCGVPSSSVLAGLCPVIGALGPLPILTTNDYCFANATRVDVVGVEAGVGGVLADLPIPGEVSYGVNYTFQDSRSRSAVPGEPDLPLTPRHKANLLFDYRPIPELSIFWHTHWVGRQFADGAEKQALESYFNQDVDVRYRLSRELEVAVGLYNLFGDGAKEEFGVPREPRAVLGQVAYRFVSAPPLPSGIHPAPEPPELGEARAAVERARAAGAEALDLTSYKEALAHLLVAEELQKRGAGRDRVVAAAERSRQAAEVALVAAGELGGAPPRPSTPTRPPAPTPGPPGRRTLRPGPAAPAPSSPGGAVPGPPARPTPTPRPTPTAAVAPTPTAPVPPTPTVGAVHVLLLQSDGGVEIYRDTATELLRRLPGHVELRDLHGDREQAVEAARETSADLVVAVGAVAATAARHEIKDRPVLFCSVLNPERYELKAPNVAGVSFEVSPADQLARIHEALPNATRVGIIYDPEKSGGFFSAARRAAAGFKLEIVPAVVHGPREVDPAFRSLKRDIDVLWVIPDSSVVTRESFELLALQAAESRLPFVAFSESFAREGALLALYADPGSVGAQCAALASRILRGESPSAIGVQAPDRIVVAVNLYIAGQLGIVIAPPLKPDVVIQ